LSLLSKPIAGLIASGGTAAANRRIPDHARAGHPQSAGLSRAIKVRGGPPTSSQALYQAAQARADKIAGKQGRDLSAEEFAELVRMEPDRGIHTVRNTTLPR